jgi:MerR HTH family regulatory protein
MHEAGLMKYKDYYEVLRVERTANADEIKKVDGNHPQLSGPPLTLLNQLVELDAIPTCNKTGSAFDAKAPERAYTARRLHHDLELDAGALALVLQRLSRVRELEAEIHSLQARLPQHLL